MVKKINTKILYILSLTFLLGSCDLNEYPSSQIPTEQSFESVTDAQRFIKGCYSYFRGLNAGVQIYGTDLQSDLLNATVGYGNNGGDLYRWDFTSSQYDVAAKWDSSYGLINNANNIINKIGKVEEITTDENDKKLLAKIKGEAHLFRAIAYHNLVIRFAKDYEPATASTDLGLPIVTVESDLKFKPDRSTVEDTYKFIKADIDKAREFLVTKGSKDAIYFTTDVIDAFEARVKLYIHDYKGAAALAIKNVATYPLIKDLDEYKAMWKEDVSTEVIFKAFRSIDERSSSLGIYLSYSTGNKAFSPLYIPTQSLINLYDEDSDIRKQGAYTTELVVSGGYKANDIILLNKYPGNDNLAKKPYEYYNMTKVFRVAEQYLIAAEAYYLDQDETNAKKWLNDLRVARGVSEVTASGEDLFNAIKKEWILEFAGEGMRLDQLKRWHDGFERGTPQNSSILTKGGIDLKIDRNSLKFVWEIPDRDRAANPNLKPNW